MSRPNVESVDPYTKRISDDYADIGRREHPVKPTTFLGKVGHVFGGVGNVLGDIFAPSTMALIPGTQLHNEVMIGRDKADINQQSQLQTAAAQRAQIQAQSGEQTAEGRYYQEQANSIPGKTAADIALQEAQAYRAIHPLATSAFELWHQQNPGGTAHDYESMMQKPLSQQQADSMNAVWDKLATKYGLPAGQFKAGMPAADANALSASLNNVVSRGQGAQHITIQQQALNEKIPMLIPDGKNGYTLQYLQPGQSVAPGALTPTQAGAANAPTSTERTGAGRAKIVLDELPGVLADIDKNRAQLGPIMGHWNDFLQGKVGTENPQFASLRATLLMMSSAVALAHAQGRLPENLREEFDKTINAPKQTADNLKATLAAMQPWLQDMVNLGTLGGNAGAKGQPSAGAPGAPSKAAAPAGMVQVQIPGQHPGYIPSTSLKKFQRDHPNAQVVQ